MTEILEQTHEKCTSDAGLVHYSIFPDVSCVTVTKIETTWPELVAMLKAPATEPNKTGGKLLKLATFGDVRTDANSLKHDGNVKAITGIEGDYDAEKMTIPQARAMLQAKGIRAVFYTSWSDGYVNPPKSNGGPRWRVLTPLSEPHSPGARVALVARLNGALGGILAGESFTLSQGFFFGKRPGADFQCVATFDDMNAGECIDTMDELDDTAIGKGGTTAGDKPGAGQRQHVDENIFAEAVARRGRLLVGGDGRRELLKTFIASRSARGVRRDDIGVLVAGIAAKYFDPDDPLDTDNIDRLIDDFADKDERRQRQQAQNRTIGEGDFFCALPEVMETSQMLDRFVFLSDGSMVFDTAHPKHTIGLGDFRNATAASFTEIPTGEFARDGKPKTKRVQHAQTWVQHAERRTAIGTTFHAGAGVFVADPKGRHCVNTWTGFDRSADGSRGNASIILGHIQWLFKDRADDYLDWLAHIEQRPGELPHTSWLHIASNTGIGRNAMSGVLARVFAGYSALSVNLEGMLSSGFNDELSGKVLAVVDEIRTGGREQWAHAEKFKQTITEPQRQINPKFGRKSLEFNACRWLIFSNHRSALPLDDTDRRVEVVISDERPQSPEYYKRLYAAIDDGPLIAAFADFLRARNISTFNPGRQAKRSDDKRQVIEVNRSATQTDLVEFNEDYPCELVTAQRLQSADGMQAFGGDGAKFSYAAQTAGWEKLVRVTIKGLQTRLFCRRERLSHWMAN
jgi:hypothetical protein